MLCPTIFTTLGGKRKSRREGGGSKERSSTTQRIRGEKKRPGGKGKSDAASTVDLEEDRGNLQVEDGEGQGKKKKKAHWEASRRVLSTQRKKKIKKPRQQTGT